MTFVHAASEKEDILNHWDITPKMAPRRGYEVQKELQGSAVGPRPSPTKQRMKTT